MEHVSLASSIQLYFKNNHPIDCAIFCYFIGDNVFNKYLSQICIIGHSSQNVNAVERMNALIFVLTLVNLFETSQMEEVSFF